MLELEVSDDGVGFDPVAPAIRGRHLGLTSMDERAALLDGTLELQLPDWRISPQSPAPMQAHLRLPSGVSKQSKAQA